jgi:hypothetical protein
LENADFNKFLVYSNAANLNQKGGFFIPRNLEMRVDASLSEIPAELTL